MTRYNRATGYDEDGDLLEGLTWATVLSAAVWGLLLTGFFFAWPWLVVIAAEAFR